jgi:hypothetical protein
VASWISLNLAGLLVFGGEAIIEALTKQTVPLNQSRQDRRLKRSIF